MKAVTGSKGYGLGRLAKDIKREVRAVLEAAYDRYGGKLFQYALMVLANREGAEDAVQQVFGQMTAMGKRVLEIEAMERYLRRAVRNECYKVLKKGQKAEPMSDGALLVIEDTREGEAEEQAQIEEILRQLPAEQREVVHLKLYEGRSFREMGEMTGVSMNTAASRYRYAMEKLRKVVASDK